MIARIQTAALIPFFLPTMAFGSHHGARDVHYDKAVDVVIRATRNGSPVDIWSVIPKEHAVDVQGESQDCSSDEQRIDSFVPPILGFMDREPSDRPKISVDPGKVPLTFTYSFGAVHWNCHAKTLGIRLNILPDLFPKKPADTAEERGSDSVSVELPTRTLYINASGDLLKIGVDENEFNLVYRCAYFPVAAERNGRGGFYYETSGGTWFVNSDGKSQFECRRKSLDIKYGGKSRFVINIEIDDTPLPNFKKAHELVDGLPPAVP